MADRIFKPIKAASHERGIHRVAERPRGSVWMDGAVADKRLRGNGCREFPQRRFMPTSPTVLGELACTASARQEHRSAPHVNQKIRPKKREPIL